MEDRLSRRQFLKATAGIAFAAGTASTLEQVVSCTEAAESLEKIDLAVIKSASPKAAVMIDQSFTVCALTVMRYGRLSSAY